MVDEPGSTERSFLRRWSQRKLAASREATAAAADVPPPEPVAANAAARPPVIARADASLESPPSGTNAPDAPALPDVASLTIDSDFTAFFQPSVDEGVRRQALRKLFADPHFNVMDGLDVYIDDYGKTVPIPDDILHKLEHAKYLFEPPKTRINARGHVEDVPEDEASVAPPDAAVRGAEASPPPPVASERGTEDAGDEDRIAVASTPDGSGTLAPDERAGSVPDPAVPSSFALPQPTTQRHR